ncbi:MAG: hypothetical protein WAZ60_24050 [Desulfosalsimonadaceae bacterium]
MATPDEKIEAAVTELRENLKKLFTSKKAMGKYTIAVEVNVSQGTPGDIYITRNSREKL